MMVCLFIMADEAFNNLKIHLFPHFIALILKNTVVPHFYPHTSWQIIAIKKAVFIGVIFGDNLTLQSLYTTLLHINNK